MGRQLTIFLTLFAGQIFCQTILQFRTTNLMNHNIDTLIISSKYSEPKSKVYLTSDIINEYLLIKYPLDTLRIELNNYSKIYITGIKKRSLDTMKIMFLTLNKIDLADTVIYKAEKKNIITKQYKTIKQDTLIIQPKYNGTDPVAVCKLAISGVNVLLKMSTLVTLDYDITCNKRTSYSKQTKTHEIIYTYHFEK